MTWFILIIIILSKKCDVMITASQWTLLQGCDITTHFCYRNSFAVLVK